MENKTAMQELLEWTRNTLPMDLDTPKMIEEKIESLLLKEKRQMKKNNIWDYVFHWNEHTQLWYAIHRNDYLDYWNLKKIDFMSHSDINELIRLMQWQ
jgi:hypothetical protein